MATQVSARNSCWLDGIAVAAQDIRLDHVSAGLTSAGATGTTGIAATAGVRNAVGSPLACVWTSGMIFNLNAGMCFVQGTASAIAGMYGLVLDTTTALTVTASDPTNPRIDSVAAVVVDNGSNTSTFVFKIIAGTPAGSPAAPNLPANALLLWNIAVAANATVLSQGVFTDKRVYSVANGGILPYGTTTGAAIPGPKGSMVYDMATDRFRSLDGTGATNSAKQPKMAAFAAASQTVGGSVTAGSGSYVTMASVSVTTDGSTEIEAYASWSSANFATTFVNIGLTVDGVNILPAIFLLYSGSNASGGNVRGWATPSAGTHTVAWLTLAASGTTTTFSNPSIRVASSLGQ